MIEHMLPMDITAGEALREWSEFDAAESQAKKGALWKRYQVLRAAPQGAPVEPVIFVEGASGPKRSLCSERETPAALPPAAAHCVPEISTPAKTTAKKNTTMPTGKYERKSAFTAKQRKRISDRMRHALTALGYTHEKRGSISVAKKLAGISSSSWHNSVNTGEQLGEAAVAKFCAGLKVERHWLVNGEGPMMQEGTDFVKAADQPSERAAVKKPRTACPEPPQYVPLRELRPVPESPSASGTLDALVAELAEETRKIATARARIAELSTQIKANVAA